MENAESNTPAEPPRRTAEQIDQGLLGYIGLRGKNRTKRKAVQVESKSPGDWTGQGFPVAGLMRLAVEDPKAYCKLLVAAFLRPPTKRRAA